MGVLVLLGAALLGAELPLGRAPLDLLVLVDDSLSIDRAGVARAWRRVAGVARELPSESRVSVLRFAADTVVEAEGLPRGGERGAALLAASAPPREQPLDRSESDLEQALGDALARWGARREAAVVLVSDGAETRGDAAAAMRTLTSAGIAVVATPASLALPAADAWVEALEAPVRVRAGQRVPLMARLASRAQADTQGMLRLAVDGQAVASQPLVFAPDRAVQVAIELPPLESAGVHRLEARLEAPGDTHPENDMAEVLVEVEGPARVLYLTGAPGAGPSPLLRSLVEGGWEMAALPASHFGGGPSAGPAPALLVLDDVSVSDMPAPAWRLLEHLVRDEGAGLLVLGGPRSFAAGGYRRSRLEDLLPVIAEARDPRPGAAILFLVDTSGSMERDRRGRSPLELARRAIVETLGGISEEDRVGVSSFASEPNEILPLALHVDPARRLEGRIPAASGGTRLRPALEYALERLSRVDVEQRLLVLVTDGFVEGEELGPAAEGLARAGVEVIALAVGADVELAALEHLAAAGGGAVLRVAEAARLPRLMRREVGERLEPARTGIFRPREREPLPFSLGTPTSGRVESRLWPELEGVMLSRPRAGARVVLESERGDPVLAIHHVGAARVAALPAGLSGWARAWHRWPGWAAFAGGIAQWLARPAHDPRLHVTLEDAPGGLAIRVDALAADGSWASEPLARVTVSGPGSSGPASLAGAGVLELSARAPGRFEGMLAAPGSGLHRVTVRVGDRVAVRHALRRAARELSPGAPRRDPIAGWARAGLLELWPESGAPGALRAPRRRIPLRPWLLLVALAAYTARVAVEERGTQSPRT
jgi:Mg-chelatase subunit ChlD